VTGRVVRADWPALGTTATVLVADPRRLRAARREVERVLDDIDFACSRFRADAELVRVNARAGRPTEVGRLLFEAVEVALRAAALTDGAVDPTVGMALRRAGHDAAFGALGAGAPARITRASWRDVELDLARRRIAVPAGVQLDLGATAKALAADRAATRAAGSAGGAGVLVSLGGDIAVAGAPPPGGWGVRVAEDHRADASAPGQVVAIRAGGLATSSTTVRTWSPGRHHIIDPASERPAAGPWRTVSVAAASCVDANIASTRAIVRGATALPWLRERRLPARLVHRDGSVVTVAGWPAAVAEDAA